MKFFKRFFKDESGAVTVDWVVLTAAVVGLAAVAFNTVRDGVGALSTNISSALSDVTVDAGAGANNNNTQTP